MPVNVNPEPFHSLASALKESGFIAHSSQLESLFNTAWTSSSEFIGELGQVVASAQTECKPLTSTEEILIKQCMQEVHKIWPSLGK